MKKVILKLKILRTNILRVITSFLFVNLNFSYVNKVIAISTKSSKPTVEIYCYINGPTMEEQESITNSTIEIFSLENILIILVPIAIIVGVGIVVMRKKKKEKNKAKKEKFDE